MVESILQDKPRASIFAKLYTGLRQTSATNHISSWFAESLPFINPVLNMVKTIISTVVQHLLPTHRSTAHNNSDYIPSPYISVADTLSRVAPTVGTSSKSKSMKRCNHRHSHAKGLHVTDKDSYDSAVSFRSIKSSTKAPSCNKGGIRHQVLQKSRG